MVLALDYMKRTGTASPEIERRARENIAAGYERLLGFEVDSEPGGFDWWGKPPANLFLTAYGLMEFRDLAEVHPVDPGLLPRIVAWLRAKQGADGSWTPEGRTGWSTDMAKGRAFPLTAYVAWGLARAGSPSAKALAWLRTNAPDVRDPYGLALGALALLASDPGSDDGRALVARLAAAATEDALGVLWLPEGETAIGSRGDGAAIETTALAIQALLLDGRHAGLARRALDRLAAWRGADGRFGTTQSTILALKALLAAESSSRREADVDVLLEQGDSSRKVPVPAASREPIHVDLEGPVGDGVVLRQRGDGRTRCALSRTTWASWDEPLERRGRLALDVTWPEETLRAGARAEARATVRNVSGRHAASVVTLEIGIPPGCDVEASDVRGEAASVERAETSVVIYLRELAPGEERAFVLPFRPRYALDVRTAPSKAYEYYVPEEAVLVPPRPVRAAR